MPFELFDDRTTLSSDALGGGNSRALRGAKLRRWMAHGPCFAIAATCFGVPRPVPLVLAEAVHGPHLVICMHESITGHLGQNRGGRNAVYLGVASLDRLDLERDGWRRGGGLEVDVLGPLFPRRERAMSSKVRPSWFRARDDSSHSLSMTGLPTTKDEARVSLMPAAVMPSWATRPRPRALRATHLLGCRTSGF